MPPSNERPLTILMFAASTRTGSLNQRLVDLAATYVRATGAVVDLASMRDFAVPDYDGDAEGASGIPPGARALRDRLAAADAFVIAAPEYNGSMPGVLKNVIDWTSRFRPQPFDGRHGLLLSASPSLAGGTRGLWALRVPFEHLGSRIFPDMFSLAMANKAFDASGRLADAALQARFDRTLESFLSLVEAATHYPCMKRAWVEFLGEPVGAGVDRVDEPNGR